jgi:hypothetical protein
VGWTGLTAAAEAEHAAELTRQLSALRVGRAGQEGLE